MEVGDLLLQGNITRLARQFGRTVFETEALTACAGDDSTWKASDWHWDSRAFVAAPKEGHSHSSTCCKKRKTEILTGVPDTLLGSCGGCKAAELAPLKFFLQTDNSSGISLPKVGIVAHLLNLASMNLCQWWFLILTQTVISCIHSQVCPSIYWSVIAVVSGHCPNSCGHSA